MLSEKGLNDAINSIALNLHIDVRGWTVPQIVELLQYIQNQQRSAAGSAPGDWFAEQCVAGSRKVILKSE